MRRIVFDSSKPDGPPRKLLDCTRIRMLGWKPTTPLALGVKETFRWYSTHSTSRPQRRHVPRSAEPCGQVTHIAMSNNRRKRALITGVTGQDGSYLLRSPALQGL